MTTRWITCKNFPTKKWLGWSFLQILNIDFYSVKNRKEKLEMKL